MSFIVYDLSFLVVFLIFLSIFLYRRRKNVKKEGLLLLYKTSWGIKLIDYVGKKYKRTLNALSYVSITLGYILMVGMLYLLGKIVWIYLFQKEVVQAIKIPPIMPLIPYIDKFVPGLNLPPFYFTYWIIIIALIAVTHEFAHGIFASLNKVKIKKTGFGFFPFFLPIFLAAFVELDEKEMVKKKKFSQLVILSAGTFANVLTAILFLIILAVFFSLFFVPMGVTFNYASTAVPIAAISSVNNISLDNPTMDQFSNALNLNGSNQIIVGEREFVGVRVFSKDGLGVSLYDSAPAINSKLEKIILQVNGIETNNIDKITEELSKYSPDETITLTILGSDGESYNRDITLEENPRHPNRGWLGIGLSTGKGGTTIQRIILRITSFKHPAVYYEPKFDGLSTFIYDLLWWTILISISVALVNMLPMGIFDGGRFFYLTIFALTKSEKKAKKAFRLITQVILFLILFLMILWAFRIF